MGKDASSFQGAPADPFEVLIRRRQERQQQRRRKARRQPAPILGTGIQSVDAVLGDLAPGVYGISGSLSAAQMLAHQIACYLAPLLPVLYVSSRQTSRELTLQALARLGGTRRGDDLYRAREIAQAFRPIRQNLTVISGEAGLTPTRLRARLQKLLRQHGLRQALLVVDNLSWLAHGVFGKPATADPLAQRRCEEDLVALAIDLGVIVLVVGDCDNASAIIGLPGATDRTARQIPVSVRVKRGPADKSQQEHSLNLRFDPSHASFATLTGVDGERVWN